jgi:hypothetical protein
LRVLDLVSVHEILVALGLAFELVTLGFRRGLLGREEVSGEKALICSWSHQRKPSTAAPISRSPPMIEPTHLPG